MTPLVASADQRKGEGASAVSDRLTAERLGELEPGDPVTIETAVTGRRPSLATGTMVRTEPTAVIIASPAGVVAGRTSNASAGGTASGSAAPSWSTSARTTAPTTS
jgi:filamentous hemagglutinin family protein